jgi:CPA1 family monovalent cation:H+ antiporter
MHPLESFELILGLLAIALVLPIIGHRLPLPPAATLVIGGMVLAAVPVTPSVEIDPDLIMVLFLPPLLLASAYFTVWRDFRAELRPIVMLAIGAVTFTTVLVGWVAKQCVPGLPWGACFALGAIVSPPDAVTAKAILHGLPLPRRIVTILEGESLVNDASGLLLYRLAVAAVLTGTFSWGAAAGSFMWLGCGGIVFGFGAGRLTVWIFERRKAPHEVVLISFLVAWFTYIVADRIGISGVLAVVTCGLVMGWHQHTTVTARGRTEARAVWRFTVTIFESLVFVLIGLSLRGVLNRFGGMQPAVETAGPVTLAVIGTVVISRLLWVFPGVYLPRWVSPALRRRDPAPPASSILVIGWAGMRGVVSMAAALALPLDFPGRDVILLATFGVIAATVLVQGSTLGLLIRWFIGPAPVSEAASRLDENAARAQVVSASLRALQTLTAEDGQPRHPQLIEEYNRRVHITTRVRELAQGSEFVGRRQEHFAAALAALAAGRAELVNLHRSGEIHDSVLHSVEMELDLEELRLRQLAGEGEEVA